MDSQILFLVFLHRRAKSGNALPSEKEVISTLEEDSSWSNKNSANFSDFGVRYMNFFATDVFDIEDTSSNPSWSSYGCVPKTMPPLKVSESTPSFDIESVYGNDVDDSCRRRSHKNGEIIAENLSGGIISLIDHISHFSDNIIIYFLRYHNFIASHLACINPCLTDDQIFKTARNINIALGLQINDYEMMPTIMGKTNLQNDGVLANDADFRDIYDERFFPNMPLEVPVVFKTLILTKYELLGDNLGLTDSERNQDREALTFSRNFELQPYIKYLKYCFGVNISCFDDLTPYTSVMNINNLKATSEDVVDIDLPAGLMTENLKDGALVTPTWYCLLAKPMLRMVKSDRHWYQRDIRPDAFTAEQFAEVRKGTAARMICDVVSGDTSSCIYKAIG